MQGKDRLAGMGLLLLLALLATVPGCGGAGAGDGAGSRDGPSPVPPGTIKSKASGVKPATASPTTVKLFRPLRPEEKQEFDPPDLTQNLISDPVASPDGSKEVFLAPYDFEAEAALHVRDTSMGEKNVFRLNDQVYREGTPKEVVWLDNQHLLVVVGYRFGTVTLGGSIYLVKLDSGQALEVWSKSGKQEARGLKLTADALYFQVIKWKPNYTDFNPLVSEDECIRAESRSFLRRVYGGALKPMLVNFLQEEKLSRAEIEELKHILDEREE